MEKKLRYLEMIQGIINRMAGNSFMLKGWAVTLVSGIFVLAGEKDSWEFYLMVLLPIITFWGLDAYYLLEERLYRSLYDKARNLEKDCIDFSLAATTKEFGSAKNNYFSCLFSKTELLFWGVLILSCIWLKLIVYISKFKCRC